MKDLSVKKIILALALAVLGAGVLPLAAQTVPHQIITQPGGMPGLPVMTGIHQLTNGMSLTWDGPAGYYQVFQKSNSLLAAWVALGKATNLNRSATVTKLYSNAFFRVSGPAPKYAGDKVCITCHASVCRYVTNTPHASAFSNPLFKVAEGQSNPACLPCHTVGYGLPTGFVSATATPQLAGVQCENCHGPAANHAAAEDDLSVRPRVDIAAQVCGGCHTGPMTPTYEEWNASEHAAVTPGALAAMTSSTNNIKNCGVCHSGSARLALIGGQNPAITLKNDFNVAITCAVCHNPHATNSNPVQLRNPMASTNDYSLTSASLASVSAFTNQYSANANINLCAQCHNDAGAAWTDTARAPHHSVQYNILLGNVGEFVTGPATFNPGAHAGLPSSAIYSTSGTYYLTNQCVSCHMPKNAPPAHTHDHSFEITSIDACLNCHTSDPRNGGPFVNLVSNNVSHLIYQLNQWAARKAPSLQASNIVAWEYINGGGLDWAPKSGYVTSWWQLDKPLYNGPSNQSLIPANIKKARFNLYLVVNDGTLGAHNATFAYRLLMDAQTLVQQELSK